MGENPVVTPTGLLPFSHQRASKKFHTIAGQAKQKFDSRLTLQPIVGRREKGYGPGNSGLISKTIINL